NFKAILFEPDPRAFNELRAADTKSLVLATALSDKKGELDFYQCRAQALSSVYAPNIELMQEFLEPKYLQEFEVVKTVRIPCDTLDNQLAQQNLPDVDFIKLDVEGHELAVLQGATRTLAQAAGVEVEVAFVEAYKGQPLFCQIDHFVRGAGFDLYD